MSRAHLHRSLKTATIAVIVAAAAILLFGSSDADGAMASERFWATLSAVAVGAFIGSMLFGKPAEKSE